MGILLKNAEENLYTNPAQTIRISEQILKNTSNPSEIKMAALLLSKSYFVSGEFQESLEYFFLGKNIPQKSDNNSNWEKTLDLQYAIHGISLFKFLEIEKLKNDYNGEAKKYLGLFKSDIHQLEFTYLNSDKEEQSLMQLLQQIEKNDQSQLPSFLILKAIILKDIAVLQLNQEQHNVAKYHFEKSLSIIEQLTNHDYFEMQILIEYANYFFKTNNPETAIEMLQHAKMISERFKNSFYDLKIYEQFTQNYLVLDNKEKFIDYNLLAGTTSAIYTTKESLASNALFNSIQSQHFNQKTLLLDKLNNIRFYLIATLILFGIIWLVIKLFFAMNLKYSRDLVNYLKLIEEPVKKEKNSIKKTEIKPLGIPKETEELILNKLEKFESGTKYLSKDMSLAQLAAIVETNTKYLSEVINKHKSKNYNLYINSLRVKHIVNKLKTDSNYLNYKVSYLAEECGFSSHSSFATVFKNITGISPNIFIELLKKDKNNNLKISA